MYSQATVSDTDPNESPDTGLPCRRNVQSGPFSVPEYAKSTICSEGTASSSSTFVNWLSARSPTSRNSFSTSAAAQATSRGDVLLPRCLPCRRIVGVDCSRDMIEHARRNSAHEQLEFAVLDICSDVTGFLEEFGQFERVYSFFCLNWVEDISAALKNISRLMSSSGECLLVICAAVQIIEVWNILAKMDRWAKYSKTLLKFIPKHKT
nr:juvenile hormone acid O-methyltransferase-like [Rhipicephalus microplus]